MLHMTTYGAQMDRKLTGSGLEVDRKLTGSGLEVVQKWNRVNKKLQPIVFHKYAHLFPLCCHEYFNT